MGARGQAALNDPFLIDECLSPDLCAAAHLRDHYAAHVNHRAMTGASDRQVMRAVRGGGFVLVTANGRDFLRLYAEEPLHAGFVIIVPGDLDTADQVRLFNLVLDALEGLPELTNRVVEVFHDGFVRIREWPTSA